MKTSESIGTKPVPGGEQSSPLEEPSAASEPQDPAKQMRVLSLNEYRDWVHDRVSRGVLLKLGAIGIGGFAMILTVTYGWIGWQAEKKVTELHGSLDARIGSEVAKTLLNHADITNRLNEQAQEAVRSQAGQISTLADQAVQSVIQKDDIKNKIRSIAEQAVDAEILQAGDLEALLVRRLRPIALGEDDSAPTSQREQALQLLTIFMDKRQLRSALLHILTGTAPVPRESKLRIIALQFYRPATSDDATVKNGNDEDAAAIKAVLAGLERTPVSNRERDDYVRFLSQFSDAYTGHLLAFVEKGAHRDAMLIVIEALGRMKGDQAIESLVKLGSSPDKPDLQDLDKPDLQDLAWHGLEQMEPGRNWRNEKNRALALRQLWDFVPARLRAGQKVVEAARKQISLFDRLVRPAKDGREVLSRLRSEASFRRSGGLNFIYEMLAQVNDDQITRMVQQSPTTLREFVEGEVERKLGENPETKRVTHVLENLLRLEDWDQIVQTWIKAARDDPPRGLKRGAVDALVSAWVFRLRGEAHMNEAKIQEHLPELMEALTVLPDCLYQRGSTQAMNFVIDHGDPETAKKFLRHVPELFRGEPFPDTQNRFLGTEVMLTAFEKGSPDPLRELGDKISREPKEFAGLAPIFAQWGSRMLDSTLDQAIRAYSMAISLAPEQGEYYLGLSRAHIRSNLEEEAGRELEEALRRSVPIDKDIALDFVKWGDEESARKAVKQSVEAYKDDDTEGRAGALENLGLYYIRTSQWQKAFDHTNKVLELSPRKAWNWAVRAIAAHHLELRPEENRAREEWSKTRNISDLKALRYYIGNETDLLPPEDKGGDTR